MNIDKQKYIDKLKELKDSGDTEVAHSEADSLISDLLCELGLNDIAYAYEDIEKWYA